MKERLSRTAVVAVLCLAGRITPAYAEPVDLKWDVVCPSRAFRQTGAASPISTFGLHRPTIGTGLDALLRGDPFAGLVTCFGGGAAFSGLLSPPTIGYATADSSSALNGSAVGGAGSGSRAGGRMAAGLGAAFPDRADGAMAGLFAFDAGFGDGSGGASGGAPAPEINAMLGLALAAGTVAFLRRKRRAPAAA